MSDKSAIEWCDATWSPTLGCTKVSAGCEQCYAIRTAHRQEAAFKRPEYEGLTRTYPDGSVNWTGTVRTLPQRLDLPLRWKKPRRIFVDSQSDLFHESVPDAFIDRVFETMGACDDQERGHVFQILTKRPERMHEYLTTRARAAWNGPRMNRAAWPARNVWVGVSIENQAAADERIPLLLNTPAAVRFLSCEPILGPLNLRDVLWTPPGWDEPVCIDTLGGEWAPPDPNPLPQTIDWVITGGESGGPDDRRLVTHLGDRMSGEIWTLKREAKAWLRSIRDQCQAAGVSYFHKQNGGPTPKAGGRLLDGRTWDQCPDTKGA